MPSRWTACSEFGLSPSNCRIVGATWVVSTEAPDGAGGTVPGAYTTAGRPGGPGCPAVLGDLRACRVDRADLRDPKHIWVVWLGVRDAEEPRRLLAGVDPLEAGVLNGDRFAGVVDGRGGMRPQVVLDEVSRLLRAVG